MSSEAGTQKRAVLRLLSIPCVAALLYVLVFRAADQYFMTAGLAETKIPAIAFCLLVSVACLPVLGLGFLGAAGELRRFLVLHAAVLLAGTVCAGFAKAPLLPVVTAHGILLAFSALVFGCARTISHLSRRVGRAGGGLFALILVTSTFWAGAVIEATTSGLQRQIVSIVAVWANPFAMVLTPLEGADFALLPTVYAIWMGSLVPYPASAVTTIAGYGVAGAVLWFAGRRIDTDDSGYPLADPA